MREVATCVLSVGALLAVANVPFIVLEGLDGCGKTTVAAILAELVMSTSIPAVVTREPGSEHSTVCTKIRETINEDVLTRLEQLLLFEADRSIHMRKVVLPLLGKDMCVIADRGALSTFVFQGYKTELPSGLLRAIRACRTEDKDAFSVTVLLSRDESTRQSSLQERGPETEAMARVAAEDKARLLEGYGTVESLAPPGVFAAFAPAGTTVTTTVRITEGDTPGSTAEKVLAAVVQACKQYNTCEMFTTLCNPLVSR